MTSTSEEEAMVLVRRHYELLNEGEVDKAFELMADNITTHSVTTIQGVEMLRAMTAKAQETFQDFHEDIQDVFACGDKVCVRGVRSGKFMNNFGGMKPSGKPIATTWIAVNRVENGKIVERWLNHDDLGFLQAVGLMKGGPFGDMQGGNSPQEETQKKSGHPTSPSQLTTEWLNQSLGKGGHLKSGKVKSFTIKDSAPLTATETVAYISVEYEGAAGIPSDLAVRFPTTNQMARSLFRQAQTHVRAVRFFDQLGPRGKGITVPKTFFTLSEPSGDFLVIHEDIEKNFKRLNPMNEMPLADVQCAIQKLALFHAHWWKRGAEDCKGLDWLKTPPASELTYLQLFGTSWQFMSTHCPLKPEIKALGDLLSKKLPDIFQYHRNAEPFTICHNNLNPTALLQGPNGEWAIDNWNEVCLGKGVRDVASFLCYSLDPALRKTHENDLLRIYHHTMLDEGVTGYKFQKCWTDYKLLSLLTFAQFVCNGAGLFVLEQQGKISPSQMSKLDEFKALFMRIETALIDLGTFTVLSEFKGK